MSAVAPRQTPVSVVTGFLGSGKTTLISRLLKHPGLENTAVIVNEFGEVGLDHMLMERLDGDVVLLPQGCLCCMVDGTVAGTLEGLDTRRITGDIPHFDRVIIETTGLANPAPVLQTLLDRKVLLRGYTPGLVITTVDARHGLDTLRRHPEAVQQVAMADRLLLTKPDLETDNALREYLFDLNPNARLIEVLNGEIDPSEIVQASSDDLGLLAPVKRRSRFAATDGHANRIATVSLVLAEEVESVACEGYRAHSWRGTTAGRSRRAAHIPPAYPVGRLARRARPSDPGSDRRRFRDGADIRCRPRVRAHATPQREKERSRTCPLKSNPALRGVA